MKYLLSLILVVSSQAFAEDNYWIAPVAGNWSDEINWSYASGGEACDNVPEKGDSVFFDDKGKGSCTVDKVIGDIGSITIAGYAGSVSQGTHLTVNGNFKHSGMAIWDVAEYDLIIGGNYLQDGNTEKNMLLVGNSSGKGVSIKGDFTICNSARVSTSSKSRFYFHGNYTAQDNSSFMGWQGETVTFCGNGTKIYTHKFPAGGAFSKVIIEGMGDSRLNIFGAMWPLSLQVKACTIGGTGTIVFYQPNENCYRDSGGVWADSVTICMSAPGRDSMIPGGKYPNLVFTVYGTYTMAGPVECKDLHIECARDNYWTILQANNFPLTFTNLYLGSKDNDIRVGILECGNSVVKSGGAVYLNNTNSYIACDKSTFILAGENILPAGEVSQPMNFYNLEVTGETVLAADCTVENDLAVGKGAVLVCGSKKLTVQGKKKVLGAVK